MERKKSIEYCTFQSNCSKLDWADVLNEKALDGWRFKTVQESMTDGWFIFLLERDCNG